MGLFSHTTIKNISILGCGWLGMPLAEHLMQRDYQVKGSTTTPEKLPVMREKGIQAFQLNLLPKPEGDHIREFLDTDVLIICIPPKVRGGMAESFHPAQIKELLEEIDKSSVSKIIYISSTSVYPSVRQQVLEEDAEGYDPVSRSLMLAEEQLRSHASIETTILRCGGLMGYDRIPGKYFAGKTGLTSAKVPVNYIHRDDVIQIITDVIRQGKWEQTYNLVAPIHPPRKRVYEQNAKDYGFTAPTFADNPTPDFKIVCSYKLMSELDYKFKYPNPLHFLYGEEIERSNGTPDFDNPLEMPDIY